MIGLYDKYYGILKHVNNIMNLTDNKELKDLSKKTILDLIEQLCEKDTKNKKAYENILEEFGLKKSVEEQKNEMNVSNNSKDVESKVEENLTTNDLDEEFKKSIERKKEEKKVDLTNEINDNKSKDAIINKEITNDNKKTLDKNEEVLKIKKVSRSYNSKLKNKALSLLALVGIGTFNPLVATGIGIGGYYLYKKGIKNAKSLIESNGLKLDENDNLIDLNGKLINKEEIGKLKYNLVKKELSKINNKGKIDSNYKKNRLTSMLLSIPSNLFKSIKNKYEKIKINKENVSEEVKDMNKGLGIIK